MFAGAPSLLLVGVIVEFRATFDADDRPLLIEQARIPRSRRTHRFRENGGGSVVGHSVQRFIPVVISRQAKALNARRGIFQLRHFFGERHAANQIAGAISGRARRITPDYRFLDLRHAAGRG